MSDDDVDHPDDPAVFPELAWLDDDCRRVGVVVPPSNPVVERELDALVGDDHLVYTSRLPRYVGMTLQERNHLYVPAYAETLDRLAGLDVECALVAMTGPNYRLGLEGDRQLCAELTTTFGAPVRTTSLAIHDVLTALGVSRIHLVSPYPDWLTDEAERYWTGAGMSVVAVDRLLSEGEKFRAYETSSDEVVEHLESLAPEPGCAVLLTGTGMVSIASIYRFGDRHGVPILSSNLCGAWWILRQSGRSPGSGLYRQVAPGHMPRHL